MFHTLAVTGGDRWLLAFTVSTVAVLTGGTLVRRAARRRPRESAEEPEAEPSWPGRRTSRSSRGVRRRAGSLVALGPIVGLAAGGSPTKLTVVTAVGAVALALLGLATERRTNADRVSVAAVAIAAGVAVAAGARIGPTGVGPLDVAGALLLVWAVTMAVDGLGNVDALASGFGLLGAIALVALAGFAHQDSLAAVGAGLAGTCFAFLAFNTRPASLFIGRGGRLAIGYTIAVGALAARPVAGPWRDLSVPFILTGVLLLDAAFVVVDRLRRRRPIWRHRADHLVHRLVAGGWSPVEAVGLLLAAQLVLAGVAVFTGRAVMSVGVAAAIVVLVLVALGVEGARGRLERERPDGFNRLTWVVIGLVAAVVVAGIVPIVLVANDARDLMEQGRSAASRGLAAARNGDTIAATAAFNQASVVFGRARDKLDSPLLSGGLAVPLVASNVRAARSLSEVGNDLAHAGVNLTSAVDPTALEVVGGRLPIEEVKRITPQLEAGSRALSSALARVERVRDDPFLLGPVRDAVNKIEKQLRQADGEARRAAAAARLAPAIFGGDGPRVYLLVVQNNAESRATGGFIGSYGLITAINGKLTVGRLLRTVTWNEAVAKQADVSIQAPSDYMARYAAFDPAHTLQNVNLSPDFPSVAQVLMSLAPQAGLTKVDGILSVDPVGLGALLQLSGPVNVAGWPTSIDASNVVDVTLRDAYAAFAQTPARADFLGDVAQAAVDKATAGSLGKPANIAKVLGGAAHAGHVILAFSRPAEERLAEQLAVAGKVEPVRSDAVAVTTSNASANKIDYYLQRDVDYQVHLSPNDGATSATATADVTVKLDNTAPASGLPQVVIGPFLPGRFQAGENRTYVSLYSPLALRTATLDGKPIALAPGTERNRNVYSVFTSVFARSTQTLGAHLGGSVKLHDGWYQLDLGHQPTLRADHVSVSIDVPKGWRIAAAPGMEISLGQHAGARFTLEKAKSLRVHVVRDPGTWNLWDRLEAGT